MRTRHPFADIEERAPQMIAIPVAFEDRYDTTGLRVQLPEPAPVMHSGENRRQRRAAVATFAGPKELGPGLRRDLLEKRQAKALGTLDPALRRLQRKALRK